MKYTCLVVVMGVLLGVGQGQIPDPIEGGHIGPVRCPKGMICQEKAIPPTEQGQVVPKSEVYAILPLNSALNAYIEKHCRVVVQTGAVLTLNSGPAAAVRIEKQPSPPAEETFGQIKCDQ